MPTTEVNFDGLVGPTHNYAGLAFGNLASVSHAQMTSNPRAAVKQGINKMRLMMSLGITQAVLPPHYRPHWELLSQLGFTGTQEQVTKAAFDYSPALLAAVFSASSMWTANCATVSASADCVDHRVHITPANLSSQLHRSLEASFNEALLRRIFADETHFSVHAPLPSQATFSDEGAANHTRFCVSHDQPGVEFFVYGRSAMHPHSTTTRFPARQTLEASQMVARRHLLDPNAVVYAQQLPQAIDAGVFHNDVIAVGNLDVLFCHELSFLNQLSVMDDLRTQCPFELQITEVKDSQVSLTHCVASYLFNSQLVNTENGKMALIAPIECEQDEQVKRYLDQLQNEHPRITRVHYIDTRQSMNNGGGPACLRLRVCLNEDELAAVRPGIIATPMLLDNLDDWADRHYRTHLSPNDLLDPTLVSEVETALDELTHILNLGTIYPFQ